MATLSSALSASVEINGTTYSLVNNESITLTNDDVVHQVYSVPTSETVLGNLGSLGAGSINDLAFGVIINRDGTNFVRLRISDTGGATADIKLKAGEAFLLHSRDLSVSATEGAFASFSSIDNIKAQADTAACDVELLLAY